MPKIDIGAVLRQKAPRLARWIPRPVVNWLRRTIHESEINHILEHTKLGDNAKVVQTDALSFLKLTKDKFDIVFLDPPYASSLVTDSMKLLSDVVAAGGCAICETPVDSELPESFGELKFHRSYRYGKIKITVYRKEGEDE